jgi:hypothetical protein
MDLTAKNLQFVKHPGNQSLVDVRCCKDLTECCTDTEVSPSL